MTAFDTAFSLLKIDEGMWEEIYAPLFEVLGGRGQNPHRKAGTNSPLDFMLTSDLPEERHWQLQEPDDSEYIERLMQSILEDGYMGRDSSHWRWRDDTPEQGRARYDANKRGETTVGNVAIPNIGFDRQGWVIGEGNHRTAALRRLGAPYIPTYASSNSWGRKSQHPYSAELPMGEDLKRWMGADMSDEDYLNHSEGYGIGANVGRRGMGMPTSFLFGQELVPGMGRMVPDLPDGLTAADMPLAETRRFDGHWGKANDPEGHFYQFQNDPKWKVVHDE
tara:strand:+ start:78 stop:911 length:834 start_codon:yes stop_codon:yes gene_type:complete